MGGPPRRGPIRGGDRAGLTGRLSTVQSGKLGPAPGRLELSEGILRGEYAMALGSETLNFRVCILNL